MIHLLPAALLSMTACVKYQFATVSGDVRETERGDHIVENDTLKLIYNFSGKDCPVAISIENKLGIPLYVDWKRSAIIINNESFTYWRDVGVFQGTLTGTEIEWTPWAGTSSGIFKGEVSRNESVSFIPPQSYKEITLLVLHPAFIKAGGRKADHHDEMTIGDVPVSGLQYEYSRDDSPFRYRSYLTVSTDPSFRHPRIYENEFWVSDLFETMTAPKVFLRDRDNRRKYFVNKKTGVSAALGVTALAAAVVVSMSP